MAQREGESASEWRARLERRSRRVFVASVTFISLCAVLMLIAAIITFKHGR